MGIEGVRKRNIRKPDRYSDKGPDRQRRDLKKVSRKTKPHPKKAEPASATSVQQVNLVNDEQTKNQDETSIFPGLKISIERTETESKATQTNSGVKKHKNRSKKPSRKKLQSQIEMLRKELATLKASLTEKTTQSQEKTPSTTKPLQKIKIRLPKKATPPETIPPEKKLKIIILGKKKYNLQERPVNYVREIN